MVNCFLQTYSLWADSLSLELLIICWLSVQQSCSARNFNGSHSVLLRVAPNGWRLALLAGRFVSPNAWRLDLLGGRGLYCWTWKSGAYGIAICQWSIVWICFLDMHWTKILRNIFLTPIAEQVFLGIDYWNFGHNNNRRQHTFKYFGNECTFENRCLRFGWYFIQGFINYSIN